MDYHNLKTEQLVKKIEERKKLLNKIVKFIEDVVLNHGYVTRRVSESCNVHVIKQFDGFRKFIFVTDWSQTVMGGNEVKVWHYRDSEDANPNKTIPVLHVYYQGVFDVDNDCSVKNFDEDCRWQTAIKRVIKKKDYLLNQFLKAQEGSIKEEVALDEKLSERSRIEINAKRLGI